MALRADKENEPESSASISNVEMNLLYSGVDAKYLMNEAKVVRPLYSRQGEKKDAQKNGGRKAYGPI